MPNRQSRRGFTLIELLTVIAIIAVLLALFMPALKQGRFAARKAACASQLRQVHVMMSAYTGDFASVPPASRDASQKAFGSGSTTLGFGLLTWNGYCDNQYVLACPDTNYRPGSEWQTPFDSGKPYDFGPGAFYYWAVFRQPNTFPMRGKQRFLYGDWDGNSNYKEYGNASSYFYRRSGTGGRQGGLTDQRTMSDLPKAYIACVQQWSSGGWGGVAYQNFCHLRKGSNALYRDGSARWLDLTHRRDLSYQTAVPANDPLNAGCPPGYLPYCYHFDYSYSFPAMAFWQAADQN